MEVESRAHQGFIYHARQTNKTTKPNPCAPLHTKAAALDVCVLHLPPVFVRIIKIPTVNGGCVGTEKRV
jgi:hypothetical protein